MSDNRSSDYDFQLHTIVNELTATLQHIDPKYWDHDALIDLAKKWRKLNHKAFLSELNPRKD